MIPTLSILRREAKWLYRTIRRRRRGLLREQQSVDRFRRQFELLENHNATERRFKLCWNDRYLISGDATKTTSFDRHYVFHTAWATRKILEKKPPRHIDIASSLYFVTQLSASLPVEFYDLRETPMDIPGLKSGKADLTALPFDAGAIESISCMHVIEHVGLGRYGDQLDYDGDLKSINELMRVCAPGGHVYFVSPVAGEPYIAFNAHRVYRPSWVVEYFENRGFQLEEFALIPEDPADGDLVQWPDAALVERQTYGCGCFCFAKR